jgi:HEAT repeat protein
MRTLGQCAHADSIPLLLMDLEHRDPVFRQAAVDALGGFADPALPGMIEQAAVRDPALAEPARHAIRKINALLSQDRDEIVNAWVESPEYEDLMLGAGVYRDELISVATDARRTADARTHAARLLALRGGPRPPRELAPILRDTREPLELRVQVAVGFGIFRFVPGLPILVRVSDEDAPELQTAAITALGRTRSPHAVEPLVARWDMRGGAFRNDIRLALWRIFQAGNSTFLERSLRSGLRYRLQNGVVIEDDTLHRDLRSAASRRLNDPDSAVRRDAILLLTGTGEQEDASRIAAVSQTDPDPAIRDLAHVATGTPPAEER